MFRIARFALPVVVLFCLAPGAGAQDAPPPPAPAPEKPAPSPPCSTPEYRQFDFWLGEWDVVNQLVPPDKAPKATNRLTSLLGGCAMQEDYEATTPQGTFQGTSLNFYDKGRKKWRQLWIDFQGNPLELEGDLVEDSMVLTSPDGKQRVTWTPLEGGKVRQLWETTKDGGETWKAVFDGIYSPRDTAR